MLYSSSILFSLNPKFCCIYAYFRKLYCKIFCPLFSAISEGIGPCRMCRVEIDWIRIFFFFWSSYNDKITKLIPTRDFNFEEILDPDPTKIPGSGTLGQKKSCPAGNWLSLSCLVLNLAVLWIRIRLIQILTSKTSLPCKTGSGP